MVNKQATSKTAGKPAAAKVTKMVLNPGNVKGLCVLPHTHIQEVITWLNSDQQRMPQNEVRQCIKLLSEATMLEFENK